MLPKFVDFFLHIALIFSLLTLALLARMLQVWCRQNRLKIREMILKNWRKKKIVEFSGDQIRLVGSVKITDQPIKISVPKSSLTQSISTTKSVPISSQTQSKTSPTSESITNRTESTKSKTSKAESR